MAAAVVLIGYLFTLAPTVTFWDAGEFLTAARTLGIPHPPGTPFYVLLAHVWGMLVPFGGYAWRLNLLSAVCGALAAGCWFLVAHAAVDQLHGDLDRDSRRTLARCAGGAAALLTAFTFTIWQNSTETEAHTLATLLIAVAAWLAVRWRAVRATPQGPRLLLVILYLGALSIGTHLLALLVGPAVVALLVIEAQDTPLDRPDRKREEWARTTMFAATWLLLIAVGLGSSTLTLATFALVLAALVFAVRTRQVGFAVMALIIVVLGVTPYLFVLLRARQGPWLNETNPATWDAVLDVIRRAQYPVRTPLDDPTVLHGAMNPGRDLGILATQLANYGEYFDWQWARSIGAATGASIGRLAVTLAMLSIGLRGARVQRRADRPGFWFVLALFVVTGVGLVLYMNFKPGPSVGWSRWPDGSQHEVRERDYFFVASFIAWGVWVAIGLADLARRLIPKARTSLRPVMLGVFAVAIVPFAFNFSSATRRQSRDATFAHDFARALLASVPPNGVLFTWGDNDTFPLWYEQGVEGFRPDITVVCLALAETPWYMKQLRDRPSPVAWPLHALADSSIDRFHPIRTDQNLTITLRNGDVIAIPTGTAIYGKDMLIFQILQQNAGRRPIAWSVTAADALWGLGPQLVQSGLALVMPAGSVDSSGLVGGGAMRPERSPFDLTTTRRLMDETWRYGKLDRSTAPLDPNVQAMASTWADPIAQAGVAFLIRADTAAAIAALDRAVRLAGDSLPRALLGRLRQGRAQ